MKRKEYIQPEVQILEMETSNIMTNSLTNNEVSFGSEAESGSSDAASYRNNLWEN